MTPLNILTDILWTLILISDYLTLKIIRQMNKDIKELQVNQLVGNIIHIQYTKKAKQKSKK